MPSQPPQNISNTKAPPQAIKQERATELFGAKELEPVFQAGISSQRSGILRVKLPADAANQAFECLLVNPVLAAEAVDDLGDRLTVHPLVMSELQILHAIGLDCSQEHCAYTLP